MKFSLKLYVFLFFSLLVETKDPEHSNDKGCYRSDPVFEGDTCLNGSNDAIVFTKLLQGNKCKDIACMAYDGNTYLCIYPEGNDFKIWLNISGITSTYHITFDEGYKFLVKSLALKDTRLCLLLESENSAYFSSFYFQNISKVKKNKVNLIRFWKFDKTIWVPTKSGDIFAKMENNDVKGSQFCFHNGTCVENKLKIFEDKNKCNNLEENFIFLNINSKKDQDLDIVGYAILGTIVGIVVMVLLGYIVYSKACSKHQRIPQNPKEKRRRGSSIEEKV